jgi:hypothetical protein
MFSAWEARLVKRFINNFRVVTWNGREPYIDRSDPFGEYTIYIPRSSGGATFPWSKLAFGYSLSGTTCTIYGGSIRIARVGTYAVGETNVTLSGAVVWIYVRHAYDHGETTIEVSATEPSGSTDYMEFPLYNFVRNAGGAYELSRICNMGDIVGYAGIK